MAGVGRRRLLQTASAAAGGLALASQAGLAPTVGAAPRAGSGSVVVRWIGGGVVEIATPDNRQVAYVDAWVWNNAGYTVLNVPRPPEFSNAAAFRDYVMAKSPSAVLVMLTHDHGDHIGDYFELIKALSDAGLPLKTTGQSDLMRFGLVQKFKEAGLDPAQVVVNGGAGQNFGGVAQHGDMQAWLVPAVHSNGLGYPAAGYVLSIGGVRVYASGDTDLFGDMRLIADRYKPDIAFVCSGAGPYTMGPRDAAMACMMTGVSQAMPVHYGHNMQVLGLQAADQFKSALAQVSPNTTAQVLGLGESRTLTV